MEDQPQQQPAQAPAQTQQPGPPPTPPSQGGVPMAQGKHTHASVWLLGILFVLTLLTLVAASIYFIQSNADLMREADIERQEKRDALTMIEDTELTLEELQAFVDDSPDFYYTTGSSLTTEDCCEFDLHAVDPLTGKDDVIYSSDNLQIFAVPQRGFDGRIFVTTKGDSDVPGITVYALDTNNPTDLTQGVGFENAMLSPDETRVLVPTRDGMSLSLYNLLEGRGDQTVQLEEGENFFTTINENLDVPGPPNTGFFALWKDLSCVQVSVKEEALGPEGEVLAEYTFKEYREFCFEDDVAEADSMMEDNSMMMEDDSMMMEEDSIMPDAN